MAEAVTAVGLAASVVQLIGATVKAYQYLNDVKNAPKERAHLSLEAANLLPLLNTLRDQVENADPNDPWIEGVMELGGPGGPFELFTRTMDQLKRKLKTDSPMLKLGKHLVWTLSKDDIHQILAHIERFKSRLILALQKDSMKLSRAIKTDTAAQLKTVLKGQGSGFCPPPNSYAGETVPRKRSSVLYANSEVIEGIPGAGKTIIASLVIDHLNSTFAGDRSTIVLYWYCFYKDRSQQTLATVIAGLIKQLIQALNFVPNHIKDLYELSMRNRSRPKQGDLSKILRTELRLLRKVFIVVDALDEYSENEAAQRSLLDELISLREISNLMVTSRPVSPFVDAFDDAMHITVSAENADVRRYLTSQISSLPRCVRNKPALQELIVQTITGAVGGMFLLARLHVRSLVDKINTRKIEEALKALPKGSGPAATDLTYDETIERINSQESGFRDLALTILSWISLANRPLTVTELLYALSIEPGDTAIDEENFVDQETLTSVCAGFVVIDRSNGSLRLAHYTMQEYFDRRKHELFQDANTDITMTCITYLLFDEFSTYTEKDLKELQCDQDKGNARLEAHPLLDYATNYWGYHLVHSDRRATKALFLKFLGCYVNLAASMATSACREEALFSRHNGVHLGDECRVYPDDVHGLWVAAKLGLDDIICELLDTERGLTSTLYRRASDALCVALLYDNRETAELLIERTKGTIVVAEGSHALHCAVYSGNELCVSMLLKAGADVNSDVDCVGHTPLNYAVCMKGTKSVRILEMLLAAGADVNGKRHSPLSSAVAVQNAEAAHILLKKGADTAKNKIHSKTSVLADAVARNAIEIVDLLLLFGADVSWREKWDHGYSLNGSTVLHYAGSSTIVSQLIKYGADVNAANIIGWTPLHVMAASNGLTCNLSNNHRLRDGDTRYEIAVLLIDNGASVNKRGYKGRTPLHCAIACRDVKFARLLLESGADCDVRDDAGVPALIYAHTWFPSWRRAEYYEESLKGATVIKALLVEFGADPKALADEMMAREPDLDNAEAIDQELYVERRDAIVHFLLDTRV